jgi:trimethylamine--corrinoid protein Co-methyltransferase
MELRLRAFTDEDRQLVHDKTIEILKEVGVSVKSARAFEILKAGGAKELGGDVLAITEHMVSDALAVAPKSYVLGARNPKYDYPMPSPVPHYGVDGVAPAILDLDTGKERPSTKQDVYNIGRVFNKLNLGAVAWTGCSALDVSPETHSLHEFAAIVSGTSKHVQLELRQPGEAKYAIEILREILGNDNEVKRRKIASVLFCPISPLVLDDSMLDAYLELAPFDVPVNIYPCPIIGLTSPPSVFSIICQINAEVLVALVLFELLKPGIPAIYGSCSGNADKVTGDYFYGDESSLVSCGSLEMAHYYGLPNYVAGGNFEDFPNLMLWPDLLDGFGTINNGLIFDMELMVIHNEIANRMYRQIRGIDTGGEADFVDELKAVGPGGNFIGRKSTRAVYRAGTELYSSKLFSDTLRTTRDEMDEMRKIANAYIKEVLAEPAEDELPERVRKRIDEICAEADAELTKAKEES